MTKRKNGEGTITPGGYLRRKENGIYKQAHVIVAEKILGRELLGQEIVHHVNENKLDNRPENLVICPNKKYHNLLHRRMRAISECGNANWLKCEICKKYDDPSLLYISHNSVRHNDCHSKKMKAWHLANGR
jgi:hypothetical protein